MTQLMIQKMKNSEKVKTKVVNGDDLKIPVKMCQDKCLLPSWKIDCLHCKNWMLYIIPYLSFTQAQNCYF